MGDKSAGRTLASSLKSVAGLICSMFGGFVAGWIVCILLGPQGIAGIAIVCTCSIVGATAWWSRGKGSQFGCGLASLVLFIGYVLLWILQSTH